MKVELKNKIVLGLWLLVALSILMLFIAAAQKRKHSLCAGTQIEINGANQNYFVTQKEIEDVINSTGLITEKYLKNIDLIALEKKLQQNFWISKTDLYFDNNNLLNINIEQRQPIARLFNVYGGSCYLDKNGLRLSVKNGATARVLVITNFPSNNNILSNADSVLLASVTKLANYISIDTFWNAQIAQINIDNTGKFELIPTIGNHTIAFGDTTNTKEKFNKLYTFYAKAWLQNGVDAYETIDVKFNNQIVTTQKGTSRITAIDSVNKFLVDSIGVAKRDSL
ncbi:MAG: hypothetical protein NTZ59_02715 [Bacteroidetes bacterium]|nr:hypothetical protein [Bacteroidota bacterium]